MTSTLSKLLMGVRNCTGRRAAGFSALILVASPAAAQTYTIIDLGTLGTNSRPRAIEKSKYWDG